MKKFFTSLFTILLTVGIAFSALAQTISGTITDSKDGSGLPGVSVLEKGTTNGTVSDGSGKFSLTLKNAGATLIISSIGYKSQEVSVAGQSTLTISMEEDIAQLSDVVVVGYGEVEKRDVTGAMATLKSTDFNAGVINSPEQLFQGKLSGVQVTQNSGEPGGGITINIRGGNSIRSGNNPLYVVDGFPLDGRDISSAGFNVAGLGNSPSRNPLNFINPDDIENIDVLKDASATAIYGTRGSNGVIMITTKKAKTNEGSLNINSFYGFSKRAKKLDLMNRSQFLDAFVDAVASTGVSNPSTDAVDFEGNTDWQDEVFRTAKTQSHSISFSRGTDKGAYRFSMSYLNQEGIVKTSSLERITARINASNKLIQDRLSVDYQLTVGHTNDRFVPITNDAGFEGSLIGAMLQANPSIPVRRSDGTLLQKGEIYRTPTGRTVGIANDFNNPVAMIDLFKDKSRTTRILGNAGFTLNILKGLDYRLNIGVDVSNSTRTLNINSSYKIVASGDSAQKLNANPGRAGIANINLYSIVNEHFLTYKTEFGQSTINVLGGFSYQEFTTRGNTLAVQNTFVAPGVPDLGTDNMNLGVEIASSRGSFNQTNKIQSFFGRVNYELQNKYLATVSLRADGSSRFGANNRYGYFPSLALAWRISEEAFIPELFDELKVRFGIGITGNQEFPNGVSQSTIGIRNGVPTLLSTPNDDIKWEQTTQWNIGADFSILKGRINGTVDFFNKKTKNLLAQIILPQPAVTEFVWQNLNNGILINSGIELNVNAFILRGDANSFKFDVSANFTYYTKNEFDELGTTFFNTGAINGQGLSGAYAQRIANGQPLGAFYMVEFDKFENGIALYKNDNRLVFVGSALPDFLYGFTTNFSFKGIDLSANFNGVAGNKIYNNTANALFTKGSLTTGRNAITDLASSPESGLNAPDVSTYFLESGSFLRLNNLTLGYTFKTSNINWLKKLRAYIGGQNLFIITNYSGYDPEVNINKQIDGVPSFGIDYTGYPRNRTFILGVNITL